MPNRTTVFDALNSERNYQDTKHGNGSAGSSLNRTVDEFALYIEEYAAQLRHLATTSVDMWEKLNAVRKVGALAVACMEAHGAPYREEYK